MKKINTKCTICGETVDILLCFECMENGMNILGIADIPHSAMQKNECVICGSNEVMCHSCYRERTDNEMLLNAETEFL